jgi:hypothetical protein
MNLGWHFLRGTGNNMKLRDGRAAVVGEWLTHNGQAVICQSGLHASWRAFDALSFCDWKGGSICLVEVDGIVAEEVDKFVCTRRRVAFAVPCDDLLRAFAREAALSVLHLWQGEVPAVVRKYLETGNKEIRDAARAAVDAVDARATRAAVDARATRAAVDAAWAARAAARDAVDAADARAAWAAVDAARAAAWTAKISDLNATLESLFFAAAIQDGFDPAVLG